MTAFTVDLEDADWRAGLTRLAEVIDDLTPIMDEIGASLVTGTRLRFERGIGPDGQAWEKSQKPRGKTLIESTRLMGSITHRPHGDRVEVGTNLVYAAIHQFGGVIERPAREQTIYRKLDRHGMVAPGFVKKSRSNFASTHKVAADTIQMPARPYLGISDADQKIVLNIIETHLTAAVGGGR